MQIISKYYNCRGFGNIYNDAIKQKYMITKEAKQRFKILEFWKKYGLQATIDAYGAKQSTLYYWQGLFKKGGGKIESLNPKSQARINKNKREVHPLVLKEIKRLRLEVCPNIGKGKIKVLLDKYCKDNNLPIYSESKIGRIIKEKKIYHHRQKISHFGKIKEIKRGKKERKPKKLIIEDPGDLIEIDTVVRFHNGLKRYVITAVDTFGRPAFAYAYNRISSSNAKDFFKKLEEVMPFSIKAVQSDNGSEFHLHFKKYLEKRNIRHYFNYPGQPYKQGHIEKFNRTIQEEFIDWHESYFDNLDDFNNLLIDWLLWYNTKRPHWNLNLMSPMDYLINNNFFSKTTWTNTCHCFF